MSGRGAQALFLVLALALPLSALVARGLPRGRALRLALVWLTIFAGVALIAATVSGRLQASTLHNVYYHFNGDG